MERVGQVTKNASALIVAKLATSVLFFLLAILINRDLGPSLAGIYAYAFALYTMFQVIPDFGIGNISIRDVSQDHGKVKRYISSIIPLRLILGVVAFTLLFLTNAVSYLLQSSDPLASTRFWVVFVISFCLLIEQPLSNSLAENFVALERLTVVAYVYFFMGLIRVLASAYVILSPATDTLTDTLKLVVLMLIYILTSIYSVLHFGLVYRRAMRRKEQPVAAPQDEALAEMLIHSAPGQESGGSALVADYSYNDSRYRGTSGPTTAQEKPDGGTSGGTQLSQPEEATSTPFEAAAPDGVQPEEAASSNSLPVKQEAEERGLRSDTKMWKYLLKSAWPLAIVSVGVAIYAVMDVPILAWIKGNTEVGLYSAGGMFAKAFVFLTLAVNMAILPAVSMVGGKHPERLGEVWERLLHYALVLMVPIVVIVPLLARPILIFQKGAQGALFIDAWPVVWLTMGGMCFTLMYAICFPFFVVIDKQKKMTIVITIGLLLKAALNLALIPLLGYKGAAVAMLASEFIVFVIFYTVLSRELGHRFRPVRFALVPFLSLVALYSAAYFLHGAFVGNRVFAKHAFLSSLGNAALVVAIVLVLYAVIAFATRMLSREGLSELNDLLKVD